MKQKHLHVLFWGAMLFLIGIPSANAVTLGFANATGGLIRFDGNANTFQFLPSTNNSFNITSSDGVGDSVVTPPLGGSITGNFSVGTISGTTLQTAAVTGSGQLSIFDGTTSLTADITFSEIFTIGTGGAANLLTTNANLTNLVYNGGVSDLIALAAAPAGRSAITFNLGDLLSLTQLMAAGALTDTRSFSGNLSAVPIPSAAWLFGSALIGVAVIARRKKSALPKEMVA